MKNIVVFGSTGSIGKNTLEVIKNLPNYRITGLATFSNYKLLVNQARTFKPKYVAIYNAKYYTHLKGDLNKTRIFCGENGLIEMIKNTDAEILVAAFASAVGIKAIIEAIKKKMRIALATKEILVSFGEIVMKLVKEYKTELIPIDSEHSAIYQCLEGRDVNEIQAIILTASGGPFLNKPIENVKKIDVLNHPIWNMGKKITVDSATMMNKGLEIIEAHHLFGLPPEKIKVLIHPEAICHSLVQFVDGSFLAQLSVPDMRLPIQYALTAPKRMVSLIKNLNLSRVRQLNFQSPDFKKFAGLKLAYDALKIGRSMPAVLNGANEEAVRQFLADRLKFSDIPKVIKKTMNAHQAFQGGIEDYLWAENWARQFVRKIIEEVS
uniref:1-deoxy-D-xylulose 5-phosphate reductoisomerase n=1 Tax=candidate division WOR-3 bacterium TaxID=2052148 RepID=A0A7C4TFP0_UNCW3